MSLNPTHSDKTLHLSLGNLPSREAINTDLNTISLNSAEASLPALKRIPKVPPVKGGRLSAFNFFYQYFCGQMELVKSSLSSEISEAISAGFLRVKGDKVFISDNIISALADMYRRYIDLTSRDSISFPFALSTIKTALGEERYYIELANGKVLVGYLISLDLPKHFSIQSIGEGDSLRNCANWASPQDPRFLENPNIRLLSSNVLAEVNCPESVFGYPAKVLIPEAFLPIVSKKAPGSGSFEKRWAEVLKDRGGQLLLLAHLVRSASLVEVTHISGPIDEGLMKHAVGPINGDKFFIRGDNGRAYFALNRDDTSETYNLILAFFKKKADNIRPAVKNTYPKLKDIEFPVAAWAAQLPELHNFILQMVRGRIFPKIAEQLRWTNEGLFLPEQEVPEFVRAYISYVSPDAQRVSAKKTRKKILSVAHGPHGIPYNGSSLTPGFLIPFSHLNRELGVVSKYGGAIASLGKQRQEKQDNSKQSVIKDPLSLKQLVAEGSIVLKRTRVDAKGNRFSNYIGTFKLHGKIYWVAEHVLDRFMQRATSSEVLVQRYGERLKTRDKATVVLFEVLKEGAPYKPKLGLAAAVTQKIFNSHYRYSHGLIFPIAGESSCIDGQPNQLIVRTCVVDLQGSRERLKTEI